MGLNRRRFFQVAGVAPLLDGAPAIPRYRVVTSYKPSASPGVPGPYAGKVADVHAQKCIDEQTERVDEQVVRSMLSEGMRALTGDRSERDAWVRFVGPKDIVGIKVNCSGAPNIMSSPQIVAAIAQQVIAVGVPARNIYVYERFRNQMRSVNYEKYVPEGVQVVAAEESRGSILGYDPRTYVEVDFFGEEDTRSHMVRLVSETLTKIINVPNMKEHQAAGITGCLKNMAYGHFSNMDRSHRREKTNTYSFIGTLAAVEPVRSRTVLHIMDGLRGVWHAGPFSNDRKFRFFPKRIMFGTDPVAMDRLLIDVIEEKRKQEKAPSLFDQSPSRVRQIREPDPAFNRFIREPGHVEYAASLGLGVYDKAKIQVKKIEL
jgi:uncharacterized protein (DUF362 family)